MWGGGGYSDFVSGAARKTILVEPTVRFAEKLREKGYEVFPYPEDALQKYRGKIQLLTSYDVIEHVESPQDFLQCVFELLSPGGTAFIGTPTEYPVLRGLLGAQFDAFVFSVQHLWVLSHESLELMARKCSFSEFRVKFYQRFGIGNLIAWLQTRLPKGEAVYDFVTPTLNNMYKEQMARKETAEYLMLELRK
jgi:SAM-dependent methyltransferase